MRKTVTRVSALVVALFVFGALAFGIASPSGATVTHPIAPVTKGQAPKPSMKQFTPPMIVQEKPKLEMTPTIIAPPDTVLPQNNLPTWGDPLAKLVNGSNGTGFGGGMGSGSGVPNGVMGGIGTAPAPVVKVAAPKGPARVSSGVVAGMAISQPKPSTPTRTQAATSGRAPRPRTAKTARTYRAVLICRTALISLTALISRTSLLSRTSLRRLA